MNALLGIILRKADRERLLVPQPRETRTWGGEIFEVGNVEYQYSGLPGITFGLSPLTEFVSSLMPETWISEEMEFARLSGDDLDEYDQYQWRIRFRMGDPDIFQFENELAERNALAFEAGFDHLIGKLSLCAIFLSINDELGDVIKIDHAGIVPLLRGSMRWLANTDGFVAVIGAD